MLHIVGALFLLSILALVPILLRQGWESIEHFVSGRGGKVLETSLIGFRPGKIHRAYAVYRVRFLDGDGNEHISRLHSNIRVGIYISEDRIVQYAAPQAKQGSDPG